MIQIIPIRDVTGCRLSVRRRVTNSFLHLKSDKTDSVQNYATDRRRLLYLAMRLR